MWPFRLGTIPTNNWCPVTDRGVTVCRWPEYIVCLYLYISQTEANPVQMQCNTNALFIGLPLHSMQCNAMQCNAMQMQCNEVGSVYVLSLQQCAVYCIPIIQLRSWNVLWSGAIVMLRFLTCAVAAALKTWHCCIVHPVLVPVTLLCNGISNWVSCWRSSH